jgi:hypothetical protein
MKKQNRSWTWTLLINFITVFWLHHFTKDDMLGLTSNAKTLELLRQSSSKGKIGPGTVRKARSSIRQDLSKVFSETTRLRLDTNIYRYSSHNCRKSTDGSLSCLFSNIALKNNQLYYFQDPIKQTFEDDGFSTVTILRRPISKTWKRVPYRASSLLKLPDCALKNDGLDLMFSQFNLMLEFSVFVPDLLFVLPDACRQLFSQYSKGMTIFNRFLGQVSGASSALPLFLDYNPYPKPSWGYDFNGMMLSNFGNNTVVFSKLFVQFGQPLYPTLSLHWKYFEKLYLERFEIIDYAPTYHQIVFIGHSGYRGIENFQEINTELQEWKNISVSKWDSTLDFSEQIALLKNATVIITTHPLKSFVFNFLQPSAVILSLDTWSFSSNQSIPISQVTPQYSGISEHLRYKIKFSEGLFPVGLDGETHLMYYMYEKCEIFDVGRPLKPKEKDCLVFNFTSLYLDVSSFLSVVKKALVIAKHSIGIHSWTAEELLL